MTNRAPDPTERLEKLAAGIGRIDDPQKRALVAHALLEAVPAFAEKLRDVRAGAVLELRDEGNTWPLIGALFGVSAQRAAQYVLDRLPSQLR